MKQSSLAIVVGASLCLGSWSPAAAEEAFFEDQSRGWFWYEDPPPEPEETEPVDAPPPPPPPPPPQVAAPASVPTPAVEPAPPPAGSSAWMREALPAALDAATDNPTPANVERYFLLQRQAMNKAEIFSEVASLVTTGHPMLDEGRRRPRGDSFAKLMERDARDAEKGVLSELFQTSALVLFLDRSCSGCALMAQNLIRLEQTHGLVWRAVSMDGTVFPPEFGANVVGDTGIAAELGVEAGGPLFLATPPGRFDPVSWNATAGTDIIGRILRVAYRSGLVEEDAFRTTQPINPRIGGTLHATDIAIPVILQQADEILRSDGIYLEGAPR